MAETREAAACAVCGESRAAFLFSARDPDGLSPEPFGLVRCGNCGLVFVSPRPAAQALGRYYSPGYYGKPGLVAGLFLAERAAKAAAGRAPGKILDVGCGEGSFLAAMARRGWDAHGVEISKEGAARASARPGVKICGRPLEECGFEPGSFDLVTLWHSIEHAADPESLLKRAAELLKDDGAALLAFPNADSWDFRLFGARWFHLDPPRHLNYFSPATMERLLRKCGLRTESVGQFSLEYNPFGFVQSVLNVLTRRLDFLYRRVKGTLAAGEPGSLRDALVTALLLPPLLAASIPYVLLAAAAGRSGCVEVRAVRSGASGRGPGSRPAGR